MKLNYFKRISWFLTIALVFLTLIGFSVNAENVNQDTSPTASFNFNSIADLSAFNCYYINNSSEQNGPKVDVQDYWSFTNGKLVRNGHFNVNDGANKIASLTYIKHKYRNFELEVDYTMGSDNYWWPVVSFRKDRPDNSFLADGSCAFVQQDGKATFWGPASDAIASVPIAGYNRNIQHHMKLRIVDYDAKLYVDGILQNSYRLPKFTPYSGYISLMSVNNNSSFDNLLITNLDDFGNPTATKELVSVSKVNDVSVDLGSDKATAISKLPTSVNVTDEDGNIHNSAVNWDSNEYNPNVADKYSFVGTLNIPTTELANPHNFLAVAYVNVTDSQSFGSFFSAKANEAMSIKTNNTVKLIGNNNFAFPLNTYNQSNNTVGTKINSNNFDIVFYIFAVFQLVLLLFGLVYAFVTQKNKGLVGMFNHTKTKGEKQE